MDLGFRIEGLEFRVWDFRVEGSQTWQPLQPGVASNLRILSKVMYSACFLGGSDTEMELHGISSYPVNQALRPEALSRPW